MFKVLRNPQTSGWRKYIFSAGGPKRNIASFALKSNINNKNNNKNHNNDNYYSTTDNDYYKKEQRRKHYTTILKQKQKRIKTLYEY